MRGAAAPRLVERRAQGRPEDGWTEGDEGRRDECLRGHAAEKQLYVVFTTPTAGPFWNDDETEWMGEGMVIVRAGSLAEAKEIAAADPMHASGARSFTVRPWLMNEGTVTVKIRYSDGSREVIRAAAAVEGASRLS